MVTEAQVRVNEARVRAKRVGAWGPPLPRAKHSYSVLKRPAGDVVAAASLQQFVLSTQAPLHSILLVRQRVEGHHQQQQGLFAAQQGAAPVRSSMLLLTRPPHGIWDTKAVIEQG